MSQASTAANRANSLLSTGPTSDTGKAISSQNRRYHGLAGAFTVMPWEDGSEFLALQTDLRAEYQPMTIVEQSYVDRIAEHMWLRQRCLILQSDCFSPESHFIHQEKQFSLLLRYQTSNERSFDKCVNQLLKLRAAKTKEEIGFESQNRHAAAETRKIEAHEAHLRLTNARTKTIEVNADIRQTCEAALPGHMRVPFEELSSMFRLAIGEVSRELQAKEMAA